MSPPLVIAAVALALILLFGISTHLHIISSELTRLRRLADAREAREAAMFSGTAAELREARSKR